MNWERIQIVFDTVYRQRAENPFVHRDVVAYFLDHREDEHVFIARQLLTRAEARALIFALDIGALDNRVMDQRWETA